MPTVVRLQAQRSMTYSFDSVTELPKKNCPSQLRLIGAVML